MGLLGGAAMGDDPSVHWMLANQFGIQVNEDADAWYSGHANDMLELSSGALLVASQTGGVWSVPAGGGSMAMALSNNWPNPDINCLAVGPDDPDAHFFAGCTRGVIRETNLGANIPLLEWLEITKPLPEGAGDVHRIVIIRNLRRIVAACSGGLFWSTIPPTLPRQGCCGWLFPKTASTRPPYEWKQAKVDGASESQGFWDVTIAGKDDRTLRSRLENREAIMVIAGAFKTEAYHVGGIFVGQWDSADELVLRRPKLAWEGGADATFTFNSSGTSSVSSCETVPTVVYAACAWPDGRLNSILRSTDGGRNWRFCPSHVEGEASPLAIVPAYAGEQGASWNNCISASPTNPGMAALAWVEGPFLTLDGGKVWKRITERTHLHPDFHTLRFVPETPGPVHNLYVCSDGGVARINLDGYLSNSGQVYQSNYNRQLPTLQCYSTLIRMFWGTMGASAKHVGLVSTGLQDNGNVISMTAPGTTPWIDIDGGDGGWNAFLKDSALAHNTMGEPVFATIVAPGSIGPAMSVQLTQPPPTSELKGPIAEAVINPRFKNRERQLLAAAGGSGKNVYGLFVDDIGSPRYHWELLATLPLADKVSVSGLGSFHGGTIFAGTGDGRMFAVDSAQKTFLELPVLLPKPSPKSQMKGGAFCRIVAFSEWEVFATLVGATEEDLTPSNPAITPLVKPKTPLVMSYVMRLDVLKWVTTPGTGLPNKALYALEAVTLESTHMPRSLFVATDDRVYVSRNDGATWQQASQGLPRCPHCSDLRFVQIDSGVGKLFLSTYGRSVWVAQISGQG